MDYDLKKFQLFQGLTQTHIKELAEYIEYRDYEKDEVIIEENTAGNELFIMLKGEVVIQKALTLNAEANESNRHKALIHLKSEWYPFFGEFAQLFAQLDEKKKVDKDVKGGIIL